MIRSVFLPISETFIYGETRELKRYIPYVFCEKRSNRGAFPHRHVMVDPRLGRLKRMLQDRKIQLIHARFGTSGIRTMDLKETWRVPMITSFHGCDSPGTARMRRYRSRLKRLFAVGDCFTVPCKAMKDELVKHGCPEEKVVVHYSGIDLAQFPYRERVMPANEPVRIIYVGRLVEKKGAETLLRAFKQVQRAFPQTRLVLVGEGRLRNRLLRLRRSLGLKRHVEFKGALSHHEVAKELGKAHIFCLPSRKDRTGNQEGIPNAIKEAMACGLPVVSTRHAGIPELIEDGVTGHLVEERDVSGLAQALKWLLHRPDTWRSLGLHARMKIEAEFNRHVQTEKLERLFDQVILAHERKELERREQPFFSVIIPTYNRERYIGKAIRSVLRQTCGDYELIVVDDGSKDRTAKIVRSFGEQVRYVRQRNKGSSKARNTGIRLAKGKYIAFLDSDDRFLPSKLEHNKAYLEAHPSCRFLYSWYYQKRRGRRTKRVTDGRSFTNLNQFRAYLYGRKFMIRTSTAVIHRSCFDRIGLFNPKYRYSQDWDMWLRLASLYPGCCQKKPLALYRRHWRKPLPSGRRHREIRKNAYILYRWDKKTVRRLKRKYNARRLVHFPKHVIRAVKKRRKL